MPRSRTKSRSRTQRGRGRNANDQDKTDWHSAVFGIFEGVLFQMNLHHHTHVHDI